MLRSKETAGTSSTQYEDFVEATNRGVYTYQLTKEDVTDIARIVYDYFKDPVDPVAIRFAISSSALQFEGLIQESYETRSSIKRRTFMLQLPDMHWAMFVLAYFSNRSLGFYIDPLGIALPGHYPRILKKFNIELHDWSQGVTQYFSQNAVQQIDVYDSGLQALKNAADFSELLDGWLNFRPNSRFDESGFQELSARLIKPCNQHCFRSLRHLWAKKLHADPERRLKLQQSELQEMTDEHKEFDIPPRKHLKVPVKMKVDERLNHFVKFFINIAHKKIAAYHLLARGEKLTVEALKQELKTGITGALLGIAVSQGSITGALPSMMASWRSISSHYFVSREKAQKITWIFSNANLADLNLILVESAVEIFISYEAQFMQVTHKGGDILAMENLAEDAVIRMFDYMAKEVSRIADPVDISVESITKAVILGDSDRYFDPSIKKLRLRSFGRAIQDYYGNRIYTADLFEKVGLLFIKDGVTQLYDKIIESNIEQYGHRRGLSWEENSQGELIDIYSQQYKQVIEPPLIPYIKLGLQRDLQNYRYSLDPTATQAEKEAIYSDIFNKEQPIEIGSKVNKKSIFFDLRNPVDNFIGRSSELNAIHQALLAGRTSAVVNAMSALNSAKNAELTSGSQISVNGLGGTGKTQLVLYYALCYAHEYDNNVLWINCENKASLSRSFFKLADKLGIKTKNDYGEDKAIETVVEAVYEYFSDSKSLFILDNVENYREISAFLPKPMVDNQPHIIITSRYQNWEGIASVISLDVFTEQETLEFLKKSLTINDSSQDNKLKELHRLLQGLPLALQQAIAYIKVQQNINSHFDIEAYLNLYKEESRKLLNFNFKEYSNDPYLQTVYTTWQITLNNIKKIDVIGNIAIEILESMSFIAPEELYEGTFARFYPIDQLRLALNLLRNYSLISKGDIVEEQVIHRLVQRVVNLALQSNPNEFINSAQRTEALLTDYKSDWNLRYHYLFFIWNVIEHPKLGCYLRINSSMRSFLLLLMSYQDPALWHNLFDRIYDRFTKDKYIDFLNEAYLAYRKENSVFFVKVVFDYLEKKEKEKILNRAEIAHIVADRIPEHKKEYSLRQFSRDPIRRELQRQIFKEILLFKKKWFPEDYGTICLPKRKKRSTHCLIDYESQKERSQQKFTRHVKQVSRITGFISTGLFTKDMLRDLLQGNIKSVAINAGLLLSGQILGELSDVLQASGTSLTAESVLLEKELALENKAAIHILSNEGVTAPAKKRFLGAVLKTAAPFVRRGTTVYFFYDLYKSMAAYEAGDTNQLSGIVSNSAIVTIDLVETGIEGAEALGFIAGISATTGPIGEMFAAFVWLGVEAYEVNRGLSAIEQQTTLTPYERFTAGLDLFIGRSPSDYIATRIKNNHLVQQGLSFLKNHPEIKRFVFPVEAEKNDLSRRMEAGLYQSHEGSDWFYEQALQGKRVVDLSKHYHLTLIETMPDDPSEGQLFCADGYSVESHYYFGNEKFNFYRCIGAIGIEYAINRTGDATFVALDKGSEVVITQSETPTIFIIDGSSSSSKAYTGSDENDLFVLLGDQSEGSLDGSNGIDSIDLEKFSDSSFIVLDYKGALCTAAESLDKPFSAFPLCKERSPHLALCNINFIQGRTNKKDIFFISGARVAVDGKGGLDKTNPDIIYITNLVKEDLKIVLRANTVVYRQHLRSRRPFYPVHYSVPSDQHGNAKVHFSFGSEPNQYFFFEDPLKNLKALTVEDNRIQFNFSASSVVNFPHDFFSLTLQNDKHVSTISNTTPDIPKNAYYVFKEGIELKLLDEKHVAVRIESSGWIEEYLNNFIIVAKQIGKSFSIQFANNQTALIGSKKSEIFTTDCLTESYLVGNGGENIYVLSPLNTSSFFLPEVTLYDVGSETSADDFDDCRDTLDLREVVKKAKSICPLQVLSTSLSQAGNALVLTLMTDSLFNKACQRLNTSWPITSIRFERALLNEWYQKMDIVLEENRLMDIFYTKAKGWFLIDKQLIFEKDKEVIVITERDLHQDMEFILFKNRGNITFFKQNETDLIVTNVQNLTISQYDLFTILFSQFYLLDAVREKVFSATFTFLNEDETLCLKDYEEQINTAVNYSNLLNYYRLLTTPLGNRTKRAVQKAIEQDIVQKCLGTKPEQGNSNYLAWMMGIVTITFLAGLIRHRGHFLGRRFRFNEQLMLIVLGITARLMPAQAVTPATIPISPLFVLRHKFSIANQCVKSETPIGLLGFCVNLPRIIYWKQVDQGQATHFESYLVNCTENEKCYLTYENSGSWQLALNEMQEIPLREIYFQLPPSFQKRLTEHASRQQVFFIWQQQIIITAGCYMGNVLTLHTPIGNLFKTVGLSLDWQARDDIHFLSRCWITMQQLLSQRTFTEKLFTFSVGLSEVVLLHPRVQFVYTYLTDRDFSTAKSLIRFIADLLQLGFYNFVYLARLLEWCFPNNESIGKVSLGLQMVNGFYSLTGDLSYWYLGMALFVLPHLPSLLETLGIPVTRCLHDTSNKLAQLFIGQSLFNQLAEDEERVAQQRRELLLADARVKGGRDRLKHFASAKLSFFAQNDNLYNHKAQNDNLYFKNMYAFRSFI